MILPTPCERRKMPVMKALLASVALLFAAPALSAAPRPAAKAAPVTVIETGEGWTFGKTGAPLLAEYASYGCPHCGQFAGAIFPRVEGLVKAGKLRFAW